MMGSIRLEKGKKDIL